MLFHLLVHSLIEAMARTGLDRSQEPGASALQPFSITLLGIVTGATDCSLTFYTTVDLSSITHIDHFITIISK